MIIVFISLVFIYNLYLLVDYYFNLAKYIHLVLKMMIIRLNLLLFSHFITLLLCFIALI